MRQKLFCILLLSGVMAWLGVLMPAQALAFSLEPTGMAKPIADLRDYNGTYDGVFGTGSIGYSGGTLYRDNQDNGAVSGCRGEGCGKHPGVDIPVPTGTKVYSVTWGQVMISRCDPSWGGLIVIKSQSPWTSEPIYIVYAHLSARQYSNGSPVEPGHWLTTGINIGKTGGGSGNPCRGNSTGPHLHFQIDRENNSPEPYYPAVSQLNQRDDNFAVSSQTFNPIPFLTGGYRWAFNRNGNRELWDLFNLESWGMYNGYLWMDGAGDPYIRRGGLTNCGRGRPCSSSISAEAYQFRHVYLDLYNQCSSGVGKVYFTTNNSPRWGEDKTVYYLSNYGLLRTHVWMASHPKWSGIITGLRIDPAEQCYQSVFDPTYYGEVTIER